MPSFSNLPIADQLDAAQTAITNGAAADLQELLGPAGYPPEKLAVGQALLYAAALAHGDTMKERGEAKGATTTLKTRLEAARELHAEHVAFAKPALDEHPGMLAQLRLDEPRKRTQAGFIDQAGHFYTRALATPEIGALLDEVGLTTEKLEAGQAAVRAAAAARGRRVGEKGEAQDATHGRDKEVEALEEWIARYRKLAKAAFTDRPELLERLGFKVRS